MDWPFQIGGLYRRTADIHSRFGGSPQEGICPSADWPVIFVFTGTIGSHAFYSDERLSDGSLRYSGRGQVGDMAFTHGNRALRDHAATGKDVLVFEALGKSQPVRYLGQFVCADWQYRQQPDRNGAQRQAIVFDLVPIDALQVHEQEDARQGPPAARTLSDLRTAALAAGGQAPAKGQATRTVYERSRDVREYVLARANGQCEACQSEAPFKNLAGTPYLEAHHIRRVSDGGLDLPQFVAAICPNCHRRAHYSVDAKAFNETLQARLRELEAAWV